MGTDSRQSSTELILNLFSYLMVAVYLLLGAFVFFYPDVLADKPVEIKKGIGVMLFVFGLFRLFRVIMKNRG
jgi:hypothetical protein